LETTDYVKCCGTVSRQSPNLPKSRTANLTLKTKVTPASDRVLQITVTNALGKVDVYTFGVSLSSPPWMYLQRRYRALMGNTITRRRIVLWNAKRLSDG